VIISDQGREFLNNTFGTLMKEMGVKKITTTPYHAQANGSTERMNQELKRGLLKALDDASGLVEWDQILPEVAFAVNACPSVYGYSPYFLQFGREPRLPTDAVIPVLNRLCSLWTITSCTLNCE
jgi:hypothetical protein